MKKIFTLLITLFICLQVPLYALDTLDLEIVNFNIEINDVLVEKEKSQFPILMYNEIVYLPMTWQNLQALGLKVQFESNSVYINKVKEVVAGYSNGEENSNFPEVISLALPERKIYINDILLENEKVEYPILEYNGLFYLPMSDEFVEDMLGIDLEFSSTAGLFINSEFDFEEELVTKNEITNTSIQIENKKIITDALNLEISTLELLKDDQPTIIYDTAKEYTRINEYSQRVGIYKWDSGDRYVGEFTDGKFDGIGVYTWASGQKYVGQFRDGDFNGIGRYYYNEQSRSKISVFENGNMKDSKTKYTDKTVEYSKEQNVLLILTEFKNLKLRTSEEDWENFMFGESNSIKSYYSSESSGNLNLQPAIETNGSVNDGIIRVRLDYFHPDYDDDYQNSFSVVRDSLEKANEYIDFDKYDSNGNGYIDKDELTIVNVIAGYEYVKNVNLQSVYAHRGSITKGNTIFDDTDILEYVMIGELHYNESDSERSYMSTIAIAAHEMGHAYGLPDLYDVDYSSNGIGPFGIMGTGVHKRVNGGRPGAKPIELSAWSRSILDFVEAEVVDENGIYNLYTTKTGKYNSIKIDINENEYLLIENKNYDSNGNVLNKDALSSGILIWHINNEVINDKYLDNTVNSDENNKGVDLIEADETTFKFSKLDAEFDDRDFYPFFKLAGISSYEHKIKEERVDGTIDLRLIRINVVSDGDEAQVEILFN